MTHFTIQQILNNKNTANILSREYIIEDIPLCTHMYIKLCRLEVHPTTPHYINIYKNPTHRAFIKMYINICL